MSKKFQEKFSKIILDFQAIADIVLGIWSILYAIETYLTVYEDDEKFSNLFYWFVSGAVLETLKGILLLYAIVERHKILTVIYLLLNAVFLLTSKMFVIRFSIQTYEEIEDLKKENGDQDEIKMLIRVFTFDYVVFVPLMYIFGWFVQSYVYKFYRTLVRDEKLSVREKNVEIYICGEKNY